MNESLGLMVQSLFEHIESAKSAIESFTSTYHTIINKKAETATDEMKNTIKSLEVCYDVSLHGHRKKRMSY